MPKPTTYSIRGKTAYRFRVINPVTGKRVRISWGVAPERLIHEAGAHIDTLLEAYKFQTDFGPGLTRWLSELPDELYDRLVAAGLVGERPTEETYLLGHFLASYHALRSAGGGHSGGWTDSTAKKRQQTIDDLELYFGSTKPMDEISADDARRWLTWMVGPGPDGRGLSQPTASKKLKDARQFFEHAHEEQLIDRNPFRKIKLPRQDNPDRLHYVDRDMIACVLSQITDPEFRLVVALGRFAGFRIPSEAQTLLWSDINWESKMIRVRSPKKAADATCGHRPCPLFEELLPFFDALRTNQTNLEGPVMPSLSGNVGVNLRTRFERAIVAAGVTPWPRLFQNLRASALTDLAEDNSLAKVCKWLGNTTDVAERHYFMLKGVELSDVKLPGDAGDVFGPQTEGVTKKVTKPGES